VGRANEIKLVYASKKNALMDGAKMWERVAKADEHIRQAEDRISRQQKLIAELSAARWSTENAENLLAILTATLKVMLQHKQLMLRQKQVMLSELMKRQP
jgi:hypothetical protein